MIKAYIIEQLCSGCGNCARACPQEAIRVVAKVAFVDPVKCLACEECLENCQHGAITFIQEAIVKEG